MMNRGQAEMKGQNHCLARKYSTYYWCNNCKKAERRRLHHSSIGFVYWVMLRDLGLFSSVNIEAMQLWSMYAWYTGGIHQKTELLSVPSLIDVPGKIIVYTNDSGGGGRYSMWLYMTLCTVCIYGPEMKSLLNKTRLKMLFHCKSLLNIQYILHVRYWQRLYYVRCRCGISGSQYLLWMHRCNNCVLLCAPSDSF